MSTEVAPLDAPSPGDPEAELTADGQVDGRTARRDRNREAVLDAAIALFAEGDLEPSAAAVAERSGVSLRSVYRYYEDLEALLRAAIARSLERNLPFFEVEGIGEGPLADRIDRLVDRRLALYDRVGGMARAAVLRSRTNHLVRAQLDRRRAVLREQHEAMFAPELGRLPADARAEVAAGIDLVVGLEAFESLRHTQGFDTGATRRIIVRALHALLDA